MVVILGSRVSAGALGSDRSCSGDLRAFVLSLLAERGEQHDPTVLGESVGDPAGGLTERGPHLELPDSEAQRERHPSGWSEGGKPIDRDHRTVPLVLVEAVHPGDHVVVELDLGHERLSHACDHRTRAMMTPRHERPRARSFIGYQAVQRWSRTHCSMGNVVDLPARSPLEGGFTSSGPLGRTTDELVRRCVEVG